MKLSEIVRLATPEKVEVIDAIMEIHPGYDTKGLYSDFSGGMGESGGWLIELLVQQDVMTLHCFFEKLQEKIRMSTLPVEGEMIRKDFVFPVDFRREMEDYFFNALTGTVNQ